MAEEVGECFKFPMMRLKSLDVRYLPRVLTRSRAAHHYRKSVRGISVIFVLLHKTFAVACIYIYTRTIITRVIGGYVFFIRRPER